jgi:hypothetical protein
VAPLFLALAIVLRSHAAHIPTPEECPYYSAEFARDQSTLAFEGRVIKLELVENESKATLEVKQVWKGKPARKTEVFFVVNSSNSSHIDLGKTYLIFARPRTVEERQEARLPPDSPHREAWVPDCYGVKDAFQENIKALGPSRPPG